MQFKGKKIDVYNDVCEYLEKLDDSKEVVVVISDRDTKEIRTAAQNRTFYKLFTEIGNHLGETKDDVHDMLLGGVFGTETKKIGRLTKEVNIEKHTSKLTKEQGIHFIDTILKFVQKYDIPIEITPKEIRSLYESYDDKSECPMSKLDQNWE